MRLKKDLVLRKIVDEYIVVPTGRLAKISPMMRVTSSTAWLWEQMRLNEFSEDSLVEAVLGHFSGVGEEQARSDIRSFLNLLDANYMLDNGRPEPITGTTEIHLSKDQARAFEEEK